MIDEPELALLQASAADKRAVRVVVTGCAYSCCGRGWQRRDGYEQEFVGWVDNLDVPDDAAQLIAAASGTGFKPPAMQGEFMLYSEGLGTISYVVAVRLHEVELVEAQA